MPTTERQARAFFRQYGEVTYHGFELWKTTYTHLGEYTGNFRMAPQGERQHYRDYERYTTTLRKAFRFLNGLDETTKG